MLYIVLWKSGRGYEHMFKALLDSYKPFVLQKELLAWEWLGMCVGCPRKNYGVDSQLSQKFFKRGGEKSE